MHLEGTILSFADPRTAAEPVSPKSLRVALFVLVATVFPGSILLAQSEPGGSEGVWWSVAGGIAGARLSCDLCDHGRDIGPAVRAAIGAYASPMLRVGLEAGGWAHDEGDVREALYTAGLTTELHPLPGRGFHLIGGIGWAGYRVEELAYDAARLVLGAGWDLPLTRSMVVGNRVTFDMASFGTLTNEGRPVARDVGLSLVRVGVYLRHR